MLVCVSLSLIFFLLAAYIRHSLWLGQILGNANSFLCISHCFSTPRGLTWAFSLDYRWVVSFKSFFDYPVNNDIVATNGSSFRLSKVLFLRWSKCLFYFKNVVARYRQYLQRQCLHRLFFSPFMRISVLELIYFDEVLTHFPCYHHTILA